MKRTNIGGQALIEGIMMKGPKKTAVAVRVPDRSIDITYMEEKHLRDRFPILGWPILRGGVNFVESMLQGYRALMLSADKSGMTDLEEEKAPAEPEASEATQDATDAETMPTSEKKENKTLLTVVMIIGGVLGVALSVFLFMYLPALLFDLTKWATGGAVSEGLRPLFEGVLKIAIFVGYIALVALTKDIRRVFMYHGAEHKTIFCFEKGLELTVENVRKQKRFHPRCGTSFMILMLIVGILIGFLIVTLFPAITKLRVLWVAIKVLLIPITCGIGYELIRICGRYDNWLTRAIAAPGMWVQRLTTKEPEDDMIEVAIASLKAVLPEEEAEAFCSCCEE